MRLRGTAVGLLVTMPLGLVSLDQWVVGLLLAVVLVAFLIIREPLWVSAALSTLLIVVAANPASGGLAAGETRLAAVFTAAVPVVVGGLIALWLGRRHPGWFDAEHWAVAPPLADDEIDDTPDLQPQS